MNPRRVIVLIALLLFPIVGNAADAPSLPHYRHSRLIAVWLPSWLNKDESSLGWKATASHLGLIDQVSFFDAQVDPTSGAITEKLGPDKDTLNSEVAELHVNEIQAMVTVTQFDHVHELLSNPAALSTLSDNIFALVNEHDFDGVDIDFEDFTDKDPGDQAIFTQYMNSLADRLHRRPDNFELPTEVIATVLSRTSRGHFEFADEAALAQTDVDQVRIMAYDENYPGSETAGANAPLPWYESVGKYLRSENVPTWKFVIGIPGYGDDWPVNSSTDWTTTSKGKSLLYAKAQSIIASGQSIRNWSDTDGAPYISYDDATGKHHIGFYDDAQSWGLKLKDVIASGGADDPSAGAPFGGMAEWAISYEDPSAWSVVDNSLSPLAPVYSAIGNCYTHFGSGGRFGVALNSEQPIGPYSNKGLNAHAGLFQQFEDGDLYYEWGEPRAYYVEGDLLTQYRKQGGPNGVYGFPIADPTTDSSGNLVQEFEHGTLTAATALKQAVDLPALKVQAGITLAEAGILAVGTYAALKGARARVAAK